MIATLHSLQIYKVITLGERKHLIVRQVGSSNLIFNINKMAAIACYFTYIYFSKDLQWPTAKIVLMTYMYSVSSKGKIHPNISPICRRFLPPKNIQKQYSF